MSTKLKALLYTIPTVIISLIIFMTISFLTTLISSSLLAICIAVLVWGFVIYKITLGYLNFQKEI